MTAKPITVRVTLDLVVDPEMWDEIYADGTTRAAITSAVRNYALNQLSQSPAANGGAILDATETHKS